MRRFVVLSMASGWCLAVLAFRMDHADSSAFRFLAKNLVLAWMPWLLVQPMGRVRGAVPVLVVPFVLFLPNAPYLLTDLVHLRPRPGVPHLLDLVMLVSFALVGVALGMDALRRVVQLVGDRLGRVAGEAAGLVLLLASGVGIHLGRNGRWNSWDALARPHDVLADVMVPASDLARHPGPAAAMLGYAGLLLMTWGLWRGLHAPDVVEARTR